MARDARQTHGLRFASVPARSVPGRLLRRRPATGRRASEDDAGRRSSENHAGRRSSGGRPDRVAPSDRDSARARAQPLAAWHVHDGLPAKVQGSGPRAWPGLWMLLLLHLPELQEDCAAVAPGPIDGGTFTPGCRPRYAVRARGRRPGQAAREPARAGRDRAGGNHARELARPVVSRGRPRRPIAVGPASPTPTERYHARGAGRRARPCPGRR